MSCYDYTCRNNCCNFYGYCPENYSGGYSSDYTTCYHYYNKGLSYVEKLYIIIGCSLAAFVLLAIACYCYRRRKALALAEQMRLQAMNSGNNTDNTFTAQNNWGQPAYSQPAYPQPAYR
jgi:hypothetical protein